WHVLRAGRLQHRHRLGGGVLQLFEAGLLVVGRLHHVRDFLDRQRGKAGLAFVAALGVLRQRGAGLGIVRRALGAQRVEAFLLLVGKRGVELLQRRAHHLDRVKRALQARHHRRQTARRREREGVFRWTRGLEGGGGVSRGLA